MFCLFLEVFIPPGAFFSMYKQDSYPQSTSFYRDMACIRLASYFRPTSKQGCHDAVVCGRLQLLERIVLAASNVHTLDACEDKLY
jgi:hypothetical protein